MTVAEITQKADYINLHHLNPLVALFYQYSKSQLKQNYLSLPDWLNKKGYLLQSIYLTVSLLNNQQ